LTASRGRHFSERGSHLRLRRHSTPPPRAAVGPSLRTLQPGRGKLALLRAVQVAEARARLAQSYASAPALRGAFAADFEATDRIGVSVWAAGPAGEDAAFDCVTCMFALHYFFHSKASAEAAIALAARNLRPGGHFVGVLPDGKQVVEALGAEMAPLQYKQLRLAPHWRGNPAPFGSAYTCALADTVTEVRLTAPAAAPAMALRACISGGRMPARAPAA
jgi:SAM-dependent methyltransferase